MPRRPALMGIIQLSVRELQLIIDENVVVFPTARISAFCGDGECLAILRYYHGAGLDYLPGLRTAVVDGVRVNSRELSPSSKSVELPRAALGLDLLAPDAWARILRVATWGLTPRHRSFSIRLPPSCCDAANQLWAKSSRSLERAHSLFKEQGGAQ